VCTVLACFYAYNIREFKTHSHRSKTIQYGPQDNADASSEVKVVRVNALPLYTIQASAYDLVELVVTTKPLWFRRTSILLIKTEMQRYCVQCVDGVHVACRSIELCVPLGASVDTRSSDGCQSAHHRFRRDRSRKFFLGSRWKPFSMPDQSLRANLVPVSSSWLCFPVPCSASC
jgi:hypothetical protein